MKKIVSDRRYNPISIIDEEGEKVLDDNMKRGGPGDKTKTCEY